MAHFYEIIFLHHYMDITMIEDQMTLFEPVDPFTGEKNKK